MTTKPNCIDEEDVSLSHVLRRNKVDGIHLCWQRSESEQEDGYVARWVEDCEPKDAEFLLLCATMSSEPMDPIPIHRSGADLVGVAEIMAMTHHLIAMIHKRAGK